MPNKREIKIKYKNNTNDNNKNKLICMSESSTLNNLKNNNEDFNSIRNGYGRFRNDNIFNYKKNKNFLCSNNSSKNLYEGNNSYDNKANDLSNKRSILSQAAKSNFLI